MISTIVDSNVIIDIAEPGSEWLRWSRQRISEARLLGELVFNAVIAAEVAHEFVSSERYRNLFDPKVWSFENIPYEAGFVAGRAHRAYRLRGGTWDRTLPDFLLGAHAAVSGRRLLTRDTARYRTYFPSLEIITPDTQP
jgi:predicted nucleic acid-binding protein